MLNAGIAVIVEGKEEAETYTADGVEHQTFTIKADDIRRIALAESTEKNGEADAKSAKKRKQALRATLDSCPSEPLFLFPPNDRSALGRHLQNPQIPWNEARAGAKGASSMVSGVPRYVE